MTSGIYTITSPSGGRYIGSAVDLRARWKAHQHLLEKKKHYNLGLQRAFNKYGVEHLTFSWLLVCAAENLLMYEQRAIDILHPRYNACPTAGSQLGRTQSKSTKNKISKTKKAQKQHHSEEWKLANSKRMLGNDWNVGKHMTKSTRNKISIRLRGGHHIDAFEITVTNKQKKAIVKSYLSGQSYETLAIRYNTWHPVIRRLLVSEGVKIRNGFEYNITLKQKEVIVKAYLMGMKLIDIARSQGTHHKTIRRLLVGEGVKIRPRGGGSQL